MNAAAPMRVFVVDDDFDTTECMRLLIKQWGHDVHVANEGTVAVEQAPQLKPDVMIVDLGMPVVDGLTVARRLRQMPELTTMSLVALTGWSDASHREQALEAGFDECLIKPLPVDDLLELLGRVASRVERSRERASAAVEAVATARDRSEQLRSDLHEPADLVADAISTDGAPVSIRVQKTGISEILVLEDRVLAGKLRQWLRERGCRVGPVFEPSPGQVAFFTYSRRQTRALLAAHPRFRIDS